MSTHSLSFDSMMVMDGVAIFLDAAGAFVLDGDDDEGSPLDAYAETGWTDGAGIVPETVPTEFQKRVLAAYIAGIAPEALRLTFNTQDYSVEEPAEFYNRDGGLDAPALARVVPPQGLRSIFWRFRIGGPGAWRVTSLRILFQNLTRRV
jgi:hypothetical protein